LTLQVVAVNKPEIGEAAPGFDMFGFTLAYHEQVALVRQVSTVAARGAKSLKENIRRAKQAVSVYNAPSSF
jgi:hypothetical protein